MTIVMRPRRPIKQESISARSDNMAVDASLRNATIPAHQLLRKSESLCKPDAEMTESEN